MDEDEEYDDCSDDGHVLDALVPDVWNRHDPVVLAMSDDHNS